MKAGEGRAPVACLQDMAWRPVVLTRLSDEIDGIEPNWHKGIQWALADQKRILP